MMSVWGEYTYTYTLREQYALIWFSSGIIHVESLLDCRLFCDLNQYCNSMDLEAWELLPDHIEQSVEVSAFD